MAEIGILQHFQKKPKLNKREHILGLTTICFVRYIGTFIPQTVFNIQLNFIN